jgi:hypothetical protein
MKSRIREQKRCNQRAWACHVKESAQRIVSRASQGPSWACMKASQTSHMNKKSKEHG